MKEDETGKPDARDLNLSEWKSWLGELDVELLFATVSGAHIYGFPSVDSDVDLRGSHLLPLEKIVGLNKPKETLDFMAMREGIEVDLVSHDVGKYLGLMVKNNGYILEQVFSPLVVLGSNFLDHLRPLAKACITRNHFYHYRGFFGTQRKLIEKEGTVTAKSVLYAYRVLCTGIHLMNSGEVITDLNLLADEMKLGFVAELVAAKTSEKVAFEFSVKEHLEKLDALERDMENAFEASKLPEQPTKDPVDEFLIQLRLGEVQFGRISI